MKYLCNCVVRHRRRVTDTDAASDSGSLGQVAWPVAKMAYAAENSNIYVMFYFECACFLGFKKEI